MIVLTTTLALILSLDGRVTLAALLVGGYLVLTGRTTVGTVVSVVTILVRCLANSTGDLANTHFNVTGSLALFQYLDPPAEVEERDDAVELLRVMGAGRLRGRQFRMCIDAAAGAG